MSAKTEFIKEKLATCSESYDEAEGGDCGTVTAWYIECMEEIKEWKKQLVLAELEEWEYNETLKAPNEPIQEPVKVEPITWEGLIDIMLKCNWGTYSSTAEAIVKRIKSDHNL